MGINPYYNMTQKQSGILPPIRAGNPTRVASRYSRVSANAAPSFTPRKDPPRHPTIGSPSIIQPSKLPTPIPEETSSTLPLYAPRPKSQFPTPCLPLQPIHRATCPNSPKCSQARGSYRICHCIVQRQLRNSGRPLQRPRPRS